MKIRKLELKDSSLMLEWMHDTSITSNLQTDFANKTLEDCENFIISSLDDKENLNLAIVSDDDEYMGTVSLKHIDKQNGNAEFAITIRKKAMGRGYSIFGMSEILKIGIEELKLKNIDWCVSQSNLRAIRFYDKNSYCRIEHIPPNLLERYKNTPNLIWYTVDANS